MSLRPLRPRRALALFGGLAAALGGALALGSCGDAGVGVDPPDDRLFFPSGLVLDPRVDSATPARWLFVANANSDLVFNAATLAAIDLDAFMAAWQSADIGEVGAKVDEDRPCRRNALTPQLIECTEERFFRDEATVHLGSFTTMIAPWDREPTDDELTLFIPVRSEPSIAMVDVHGGLGGDPLEFSCGAGSDPDERDPRRCSPERRLKNLFGDTDYLPLGREPVKFTVSSREELPLAYITHSELPELALVRLTGFVGSAIDDDRRPPRPDEPTIVDIDRDFFNADSPILYGSYGLAERPCAPGNAPALTITSAGECGRPLLYASFRRQQTVVRFTVEAATPTPTQKCVYPQQLEDGVQGGVLCEEQLVPLDLFFAGGFDIGNNATTGATIYGDLAFSRDGDSLYIVQSNPGALVRVDTSLDERGGTRDFPSGIVEVCASPTAMILFDDAIAGAEATGQYAAITCYSAGMVFIVDLDAFEVVESLSTGSGPHQMVFDRARGYIYVANTLDATIGVLDVSPARDTRFTEVARLGLQEPYTG